MLILELLLFILYGIGICVFVYNFEINNKLHLARGLTIIFLSFIGLNIITNIIKSKDSICDIEKQSKFILECLNAKELQSISVCGKIAKSLYCK
jgi:membrane protein YdbS with pleckstrin-like domain